MITRDAALGSRASRGYTIGIALVIGSSLITSSVRADEETGVGAAVTAFVGGGGRVAPRGRSGGLFDFGARVHALYHGEGFALGGWVEARSANAQTLEATVGPMAQLTLSGWLALSVVAAAGYAARIDAPDGPLVAATINLGARGVPGDPGWDGTLGLYVSFRRSLTDKTTEVTAGFETDVLLFGLLGVLFSDDTFVWH